MNLSKLFPIQKVLDERIEREHPRQPEEDWLAKKILALQVELGELANEQRSWKFWSRDQKPRIKKICSYCNGRGFHDFFEPFGEGHSTCECGDCEGTGFIKDRNPLLEEFVDCLHFILSIAIELGHENLEYWEWPQEFEITEGFINLIGCCRDIHWAVKHDKVAIEHTESLLSQFAALGDALGFTWKQIEEAYLAKNKVNHERQLNGY